MQSTAGEKKEETKAQNHMCKLQTEKKCHKKHFKYFMQHFLFIIMCTQ